MIDSSINHCCYAIYLKNKERVKYLFDNYKDLRKHKEDLRYGKSYECHCSCCEEIYIEHINKLIKRSYMCRCGSFRLGIFDTVKENI